MKYKTTRKAVMEGYSHTISVGYCNLQSLLKYIHPVAYTAGGYGWNADIYAVNGNTAIVTGYRPFGNIKPPYELQQKYEALAAAKRSDFSITHEQCQAACDELIAAFVNEVIQNVAR